MAVEGPIKPAEFVRPGERPSAAKYNQLVEAARRNAPQVGAPTQVMARGAGAQAQTGRIVCACATWKHFTFPPTPTAAEMDGVTLKAGDANLRTNPGAWDQQGRAWVLVWLQERNGKPDPATNGIYAYDPNASGAERWTRVYELSFAALGFAEIYVQYGRRWSRLRFHYNSGFDIVTNPSTGARHSDLPVLPLLDRPYPVHHGTYETGDSRSGLGALADGYTPSAGDMIWVRGQGLFIARSTAWKKIATCLDGADDEPDPKTYAALRSQLVEIMNDASCSGGDVVGTASWYDFGILPPLLSEA